MQHAHLSIALLLALLAACGDGKPQDTQAQSTSTTVPTTPVTTPTTATTATTTVTNTTTGTTATGFPATGVLVADDFESADMTPFVNTVNFEWSGNNGTSIVTMNPTCDGLLAGDPTAVYNNGPICNGPIEGRDWNAYQGEHSMRFRYAAGVSSQAPEQRFTIAPQTEFWLHYSLRVPVNFQHGLQNNKFLVLFPSEYDRPGTVTWQTRSHGGSTGATLVYQDGGVTSGEIDATPFIAVPGDRGRWMDIVVHYRSATAADANDGEIQFWRRWDTEADFVKIHEKLGANTFDVSAASQGVQNGRILGWPNDPYAEDTEWLLDNFEIADSNLWSVQ